MLPRYKAALSASILIALVTACSPSGGAAFKDLPADKSFNCAANIYAVSSLMDFKSANADADLIKSNSIAAITHYGTIYAEAEGIDSQDVLGVIKLKAYRMTGKIPGEAKVSASTIIERAKACISPDPA